MTISFKYLPDILITTGITMLTNFVLSSWHYTHYYVSGRAHQLKRTEWLFSDTEALYLTILVLIVVLGIDIALCRYWSQRSKGARPQALDSGKYFCYTGSSSLKSSP